MRVCPAGLRQNAPMADQATETMEIAAPAEEILRVLLDFDAYPTWARDLKGITVDERDEQGRAREVTFRAAAMGRSTSYRLRYDYAQAPEVLAWKLVEGDITRKLDGSYELAPVEGEPGKTEVTYHLEVELAVPLPAFVKRRAESRITSTALRDLQVHLEQ